MVWLQAQSQKHLRSFPVEEHHFCRNRHVKRVERPHLLCGASARSPVRRGQQVQQCVSLQSLLFAHDEATDEREEPGVFANHLIRAITLDAVRSFRALSLDGLSQLDEIVRCRDSHDEVAVRPEHARALRGISSAVNR